MGLYLNQDHLVRRIEILENIVNELRGLPPKHNVDMIVCPKCSGRGWVSSYHDDTEECYWCKGRGKIAATGVRADEEL